MRHKILISLLFLGGIFLFPSRKVFASIQTWEITIATGTTSQLIATTAGNLYDVVIASGTAGTFNVCFDSASVTGLTSASDGTSTAPRISDVFVSTINVTTGFPIGMPAVSFNNGLVCINSASVRTKVYYKTSPF